MRIEHEFDSRSFVKICIALGRFFQGNDARVDNVGDGQAVVPDRLHELSIVAQRGRLTRVK